MKLRYAVYDPTKNITALVTSPVPRTRQAAAAGALMARLPQVEQVGFLEPPTLPGAALRLQMMGGEFCGNASMSAAAYAAQQSASAAVGTDAACFGGHIPLEVSGAEGVLRCRLERQGDHFLGTVAVPLPESVEDAALPLGKNGAKVRAPAVRFPGIVHCVVPAGRLTREEADTLLRPRLSALCASLRTDACGILLLDESKAAFTPLVYVAQTDTAVWESGCGSGSAAIGCALALRDGTDCRRALRQPGGTIRVRAGWDGARISGLTITGEVCKADSGCLDFSLRPGRFTQQEAGVLAAKP